jgi:hypothetical protein
VLALLAHGDQTVIAQHLEVLRHGRLADAEFGHEFADADLRSTMLEADEELATRTVGEHIEDVGHTPG